MVSMTEIFAGHKQRNEGLAKSSNPYAAGIAWIEGDYVPLHEARIPLIDQGFLHSDLTYDVPSIFDGRFFRLDDHLDRLERSCAKLHLTSPMSREEMRARLIEMAAISGLRDAYVQMIVTRGPYFVRDIATNGELHDMAGNVYLIVMPYIWVMPPFLQPKGGSAVVTRTVRRIPPGAIDPTVKNLQWGDFMRGLFEAADRKAIYPFLPDGDGNITEGSGFNIFVVKDGVLRTPRLGVLEGITRRTVLEIAEREGWPAAVEEVPVEDLYNCEEIFMATTAGGIMPIVTLDNAPVGDGKVGAITLKVWEAYWDAHYDPAYSFEIAYAE